VSPDYQVKKQKGMSAKAIWLRLKSTTVFT
jgi:hypothetical protein